MAIVIKKHDEKVRTGKGLSKYLKNNYSFYMMMLPALIYIIGYKFTPLFGLTIAFKDFNIFASDSIFRSIIESPWAGLANFEKLFKSPDFYKILGNTLILSAYKIVILFPLPVIMAILMNELRSKTFKRSVQTFIYLPHFLSWVVVYGVFFTLLNSEGVINTMLSILGQKKISFFMNQSIFRGLLVFTEGWKEIGWNTVVYMAAITGIDNALYEASELDGANRYQQMFHITFPGILPVIALMLVMRAGKIMEAGFEQVLVMYNPTVYEVADIIQTYVYRLGIGQMDYSLGTAVGIFDSVIGFILVIASNKICERWLGKSIW